MKKLSWIVGIIILAIVAYFMFTLGVILFKVVVGLVIIGLIALGIIIGRASKTK